VVDPFGDLAARYALAVDRRDPSALAALFAPDGCVVLPEALGGTTLADWPQLVDTVRRFDRTRHVVHQQVVDVSGGTATGETYGEAHHLYRRDGQLRDTFLVLRYLDEFVGDDGRWWFSRRQLVVDWRSDVRLA